MPVAKPTLDPEVEAFYKQLLEKGNLSEAEKDMLHSLLGKKEVATEFKVGLNARSLTDRKLDEFKQAQTKLQSDYEKKLTELTSLQTSLQATATSEKQKNATLEKAIKLKMDQLHKIRTGLMEYEDGIEFLKKVGMDDERSIYDIPTATPETKDSPKSLTKDDILKEILPSVEANNRALAKFSMDLLKMRDEYKFLTGKDLDIDHFYNTLNSKIGKDGDYTKVYEEEYDIPNLRTKKAEESFNERVEKAVKERLAEERTKQALPSDIPVPGSDFYKAIDSTIPKEEKEKLAASPLGIENRGSVISEAVQHFRNEVAKKDQASI